MLVELLKIQDVEGFGARFFDMGGGDPVRLRALFKDACRYASSNLYPDKYTGPYYFVPHSYMGLVAAWEARRYLDEADRWRPVFQALWHLASEARNWKVIDRTPVTHLVPDDLSVAAPGEALAEALDDRDPDRFFSVYAACQRRPELRRLAAGILLSTALRDHINIGHKYIYALKVTQLSRFARWKDPGIFYSAVHFLCVAPQDMGFFHTASSLVESHWGKLSRPPRQERWLDQGQLDQLRTAVLQRETDATGAVIELLARGHSVEAVMEALLLVASHIVRHAPGTDPESWWLYPVHGVNFSRSVKHGLGFLGRKDRIIALLTVALYLRDIVRTIGEIRDVSSETAPVPARVSLESLEDAVVSGNARDALAQAGALVKEPANLGRLAERLVLLSARKETFLFAHTIKYAGYLVASVPNLPSAWAAQHILAFVRFLALTPEYGQAMPVWKASLPNTRIAHTRAAGADGSGSRSKRFRPGTS